MTAPRQHKRFAQAPITRNKVNLLVIVLVGLGMPAYYKIKFLLLGQLTPGEIFRWSLLLDLSFSFLLSTIVVAGHELVVKQLRQHTLTATRPRKRLAIQFLATSLYAVLASYLFTRFFWDFLLASPTPPDYLLDFALLALFIPVLVNGITESLYYYGAWEDASLQKEMLQRENIEAQYDILKGQISPHFLFNCFNTLSELINESKNLAMQFLEQLAHVYRFVLESRDLEVVALEKEIDVLTSYLFLLRMRFGESVRVKMNIRDQYIHTGVAPLTLQILLENAIKHNVASTEAPLLIDVAVSDDHKLIFRNNVQKKHPVASTGIGLQNIINRYKYLTETPVDIRETATDFVVCVPLMQVEYP